METKFTKGEWKVDKDIVIDSKGKPLFKSIWNCFQQFFYRTEQEQKANALLISKAPEMYKRLENNILILQNTLSYFNNIRKYINACDVHKFKNNYKLIEDEKNKIEQLLKEATEL